MYSLFVILILFLSFYFVFWKLSGWYVGFEKWTKFLCFCVYVRLYAHCRYTCIEFRIKGVKFLSLYGFFFLQVCMNYLFAQNLGPFCSEEWKVNFYFFTKRKKLYFFFSVIFNRNPFYFFGNEKRRMKGNINVYMFNLRPSALIQDCGYPLTIYSVMVALSSSCNWWTWDLCPSSRI